PEDPGAWDPEEPKLGVGESCWINLGTPGSGFKVLEPCLGSTYCTAPALSAGHFVSESTFAFTLNGAVGETANVYSSSDLVSWTFRNALVLNDGAANFTDNQVSGINYRFYRVSNADCASQTLGFVRLTVPANGSSMIANQLDAPPNTLANLLPNPPLGTEVSKWTGSAYTTYTYQLDGNGNPAWSP